MSNLKAFDFNTLKKMPVDSLIMKCKGYVEQYLSKSAANRLDSAYKKSKLEEVEHILKETLKRAKMKIKISEYQKAEKAVLDEFPDAKKLFESFDSDGGGQSDNMGTGSGIVVVVVIIVAILVISIVGAVIYLKSKNKTVGEVLSLGLNKGNRTNNPPAYTDKDRDMIALIHELSIVYDNTDKYLNS